MSELTDLEGMQVEQGDGVITTVIYEIAEIEQVENTAGSMTRVRLELVEDSTGKRPSELTHSIDEFRDEMERGYYSWVDQ